MHSATVAACIAEGRIAPGLAQLQKAHPELSLGSYPFYSEDGNGVQLVARGRDAAAVKAAANVMEELLRGLGAAPSRV
jgi:molybdopterin-biosynthesis enzyme MoeA-like protein